MAAQRLVTALLAAALATACSSGGPSKAKAKAAETETSATAGAETTAPSPVPTAAGTTAPTTTSTKTSTNPTSAPVSRPAPAPITVAWTVDPWQPAGPPASGGPLVATALLHRANGPTAAAARLDPTRLRFALYAGTMDPAGKWADQGVVAASLWPTLVATFNSGFKLDASRGGYYAEGRNAAPLRAGAASLVIYQDGSATVGQWGRDVTLSSNVVAVRQNLELLVDAGQPSPKVATNVQPNWGFTLNNQVENWRSALGVDATGQLVYVGGAGLDPSALARALIAVGVVRAMELDINPAFVTLDIFPNGGGPNGAKLLPDMEEPPNHFIASSTRDFIAVFTR